MVMLIFNLGSGFIGVISAGVNLFSEHRMLVWELQNVSLSRMNPNKHEIKLQNVLISSIVQTVFRTKWTFCCYSEMIKCYESFQFKKYESKWTWNKIAFIHFSLACVLRELERPGLATTGPDLSLIYSII